MREDVYISIDIETSGPIPGPHSMLSLGAVAFQDGKEIGEFYEKLEMIAGSDFDPDTREWWKRFPEALAEATADAKPADEVMQRFVAWCGRYANNGKVVLCANPATFDGMFVNWYAVQFVGNFERLPWKHRILDMRSWYAAAFGLPYHRAHGSTVGKITGFKPSVTHDHKAVNDAREQGETFVNAMKHLKGIPDASSCGD